MALTGLTPRDITEQSFRALIEARVPEGREIDYKQELPGNADSARRDFLADLSSFANAVGGHIIYGMTETDGLPDQLAGIAGNTDQAVVRMESMARDGIRPPLPGLEFVRVALGNGNTAIVACIPKSWNPPHQVIFQRDYRFYTRGSAGKQHIDVDELRRIVLLSQETAERIRQFRASRVAAVLSGDLPVPLQAGARQILHFVPLNAFGTGATVDLAALERRRGLLIETMNRGGSQRHNVDGVLAYSPLDQSNDAYAQLYQNGILEVVSHVGQWKPRDKLVLPSVAFEEDAILQTRAALNVFKVISATPPIAVLLSFTGIQGWEMGVEMRFPHRFQSAAFDRDPLLIPETMLQTFDIEDVAKAIRPVIDATWNAAGFAQSANYDGQGNWKGGS